MTIILDAMGSDDHPGPEVQAAVNLSRAGEKIILVGPESIVLPRLQAVNPDGHPVRLVDAPDVVEMTDKLEEYSRKKPLNSMAVGVDLLKAGEGDAFVTAGNTGAAMFWAYKKLGKIPGLMRPALTALFPVQNGRCVVLDIGANAECRPEFLVQFGMLGSVYAQTILGIQEPRVALLANGEESVKGNHLVKETYPLLLKSGLNFIGNIEPKEIYSGHADVVVTDGFTGNIFLKTSEAVGKYISDYLKKEIRSTPLTTLGGLLSKPAFGKLRRLMSPEEVGAAPLLGIEGLVFVGHGRSSPAALENAVHTARQAVTADLLGSTRSALPALMEKLEPTSA